MDAGTWSPDWARIIDREQREAVDDSSPTALEYCNGASNRLPPNQGNFDCARVPVLDPEGREIIGWLTHQAALNALRPRHGVTV